MPPKRTRTAVYSFAVPKSQLGQLAIEVEPGFLDYASAQFEGAAR